MTEDVAPVAPAAPVSLGEAPAPDQQPDAASSDAPKDTAAPAAVDADTQTTETTAADAPADKTKDPTDEQPEKRGKSRYERRLDKAYRERAQAEARAAFYEKQLSTLQPKAPDTTAPTLEQFNYDPEAYAEAKAKHAADMAVKQYEARIVQQRHEMSMKQLTETWSQKVDKAERKYDDFDEVVGELVPNSVFTTAIMQAENGPDIAYYLTKNEKEARRIVQLDPVSQVREIGRLEARLLAEPVKPKTPSKAPAPITPLGGKSGAVNDMPQDSDDVNTWMKKENARMQKMAGR